MNIDSTTFKKSFYRMFFGLATGFIMKSFALLSRTDWDVDGGAVDAEREETVNDVPDGPASEDLGLERGN